MPCKKVEPQFIIEDSRTNIMLFLEDLQCFLKSVGIFFSIAGQLSTFTLDHPYISLKLVEFHQINKIMFLQALSFVV